MIETTKRPRAEWVEDKRFERGGIVILVNKLPLRRPRYSVAVGREMEKGVSKFLPIRSEGKGQIRILKMSAIVYELMGEAEDYIQSELQCAEDEWIDTQQFYEMRDMNRNKRKGTVGLSGGPGSGKTARKRENRRKRMSGQ